MITYARHALEGINTETILALYALIETGRWPGGAANRAAESAHLDAEIPYIMIRPKEGKQIKMCSAAGKIPLIAVSFAAMQQALRGFSRLHDRSHPLSKSLMKAYRQEETSSCATYQSQF